MNASTHLPPITVSSRDLARLEQLLDSPGLRHVPAAIALGRELERAAVLAPEDMPPDVVTMNSTVSCVDELSGDHHRFTLAYPADADVASHRVSVLAPVGSALLGLSIGSVIDWQAPGGRALRVRLTAIDYQPEAAGDLHR
ncbi:nucleoside diphosphate kinase regulator [Arenimonas daejeonensis]|uniref:nucleoside diphosphate kinase regulator n=1 Tax=Arenimonas daejeonensis TaxID=370777 RepID=UPI0011BEA2CC|nr:nucleoside diphosphate kinase regulator [Arenimonas daejeonensis]